ncbi:MAG TPA: alpha/beta fold hydrolase, partial [Rudaea sp.]|nr:alpha/beta fold hydrolase [Rudaea sp.]
MTKRNLFRIVLAFAFLAYVGYSQLRQGSGDLPARALLPAVPASARQFTLGTLEFKRCELAQKRSGATTAAFCAPFQVAENPDAADSRRIDLNLALIKADAEAADTDLVVFLAGGPGQAAIENWPQIAPAFAPLRKHHHILLLDQRGTGGSHALSCGRATDGDPPADAPAEVSANLDQVRRATRECLALVEKNADPRYYTTTIAAHDLEAVRQALGAPQFDLVGVSYGTRMAQQYLVRYPDGVRSLVL